MRTLPPNKSRFARHYVAKFAYPFVAGLLFASSLNAQTTAKSDRNTIKSRPLYQAIQQSLDTLSRAEIAREQAEISANGVASPETAHQQCRQAVKQLLALESRVTELLRTIYEIRPSLRKNTWTIKELESLARNLKVQIARAYRNQALCYAENSVDRINSLSLALKNLSAVIMQPLDDAGVWQARIEQVACLRLIGNIDEAQQSLRKWQSESPPALVASRLVGEQIHVALDRRDIQSALSLAIPIIKADDSSATAPETDYVILQTLLGANASENVEEPSDMLVVAQTQLQRIAKRHGPYWLRRAKLRLGHAMLSQLDSEDPTLLAYAADYLYATGQARESIAVYDRIAMLQGLQGRQDLQFEALQNAAEITRDLPDAPNAIKRLRQLAVEHSTHALAPSLHMIAIGNAADITRQTITLNTSTGNRFAAFELYRELLQEHLQLWPDQPSSEKVNQWLAETKQPEIERRRAQTLVLADKRKEAVALYRQLVAKSPDDAELTESLAKLLAAGTDGLELREALQTWMQVETRSKPGGLRWWRARRARLKLLEQLGEGGQAEKLRQLTAILYPAVVTDESRDSP